jgi:hypothetical protein
MLAYGRPVAVEPFSYVTNASLAFGQLFNYAQPHWMGQGLENLDLFF